MRQIHTTLFLFVVVLYGLSRPTSAVPVLQVTNAGHLPRLVGATGIYIRGALFDVRFLDGSCTTLFGGCDSLSDFAFTTKDAATYAAQALLDQVLVDVPSGRFDADPTLTTGCPAKLIECDILIPFGVPTPEVPEAIIVNRSGGAADYIVFGSGSPTGNTTGVEGLTFAVFTRSPGTPPPSLPEPFTFVLLGTGLFVLTMRRLSPCILIHGNRPLRSIVTRPAH